MGQFLNNKEPYDKYRTVKNGPYFVDKSEILEELIPALQQEQRFFCITRPRRFGKTIMANMIAAFFENTEEESLFDDLYISRYKHYKEQAGRHDVIYIDFSEMPRGCRNYQEYILRIQDGLIRDIEEAYPELEIKSDAAVWDILSHVFDKTGDKFVFVMDEWDAVFHMSFILCISWITNSLLRTQFIISILVFQNKPLLILVKSECIRSFLRHNICHDWSVFS